MRTRTPNHLMYLIPVAVILLIFLANPFITATMDSGEGPGPDEGEGTAPVESVEPTDPPVYFTDVQPGEWFYESVNGLYEAGFVHGDGSGNYFPEHELTWAELFAFMLNYRGIKIPDPIMVPDTTKTEEPEESAAPEASAEPDTEPSGDPSAAPSGEPSAVPSVEPGTEPSAEPAAEPSAAPSSEPAEGSDPAQGPESSSQEVEPSQEPEPTPEPVPTEPPMRLQTWGEVLIEPVLDNRFIPYFKSEDIYKTVNRLEAAQVIARALTFVPIAGESPFADCDDPYITELYEKNVLGGVTQEDGSVLFLPDEPLTRAEISTILWNVRDAAYTEDMVQVRDHWVDVLEGVTPFGFSPDQFELDENLRMTYKNGYYALGIDVSRYQGANVDWEKVKAAGIDFVILRIGGRLMESGTIFTDRYFDIYLKGASEAGLDVGVYFFSQALNEEEGLEEAQFILDTLSQFPEYEITYPVICDWEYLGGPSCRTWPSNAREVTDGIEAFCRTIEEAGYHAGVYFNEYCGILKMDLSRLTDYVFWFAQYTSKPRFLYNFQMWQYSSEAKVDGVGTVDIDICFVEDFNAPFPIPTPTPEDPEPSQGPDAESSQDPNAVPSADVSAAPDVESSEAPEASPQDTSEPSASPEPESSAPADPLESQAA